MLLFSHALNPAVYIKMQLKYSLLKAEGLYHIYVLLHNESHANFLKSDQNYPTVLHINIINCTQLMSALICGGGSANVFCLHVLSDQYVCITYYSLKRFDSNLKQSFLTWASGLPQRSQDIFTRSPEL